MNLWSCYLGLRSKLLFQQPEPFVVMKGRRKPEEEMKIELDVTMPAIAEPGVTLPETVDPDVTLPATVEPVVAMPAKHRNLVDLQAKLAHPGSQLTRAGTQNSTDILDIGNQVLLNPELSPIFR